VYQVVGHTRLDAEKADKIEFDNLVLIDSRQCFMIDEDLKEKIVAVREYEQQDA
jgi:ribosomal protein L21